MAEKKAVFSAEEKAAMRAAAAEAKRAGNAAAMKADCLAAIKKMSPQDRELAEAVHALVSKIAPQLQPKTWYGMPAYALNDKTVIFFQESGKFKARYSTLGFSEHAKLDEGNFWPTSYALLKLNKKIESEIAALIRKAIG
ncbi:MAG: hypothetical protein RLZZ400_557 [Actinomycetota bacterium]|jgi:uncharacterized protein YdhG (YjbR/CyaY superfamily)